MSGASRHWRGDGSGLTIFTIAVCCVIEQVAAIEHYSIGDRRAGIAAHVIGTPLGVLFSGPLSWLWGSFGPGPIFAVPLWDWLAPLGRIAYPLEILIMVVIADFLIYWRHRAEHKWFWPIHVVHHAPVQLHAANDIGHPAQALTDVLFVAVPLSLVRIDGPATPFAVYFIVNLLSYYIHSPVDVHFGPLRKLLVDNRFHRIHHSLEERHFDKNFGICFSIWDRMFGTAYDPAPDEWPQVGVEGVTPPATVAAFLGLPVRFILGRRTEPGELERHDQADKQDTALGTPGSGSRLEDLPIAS